tara:strand:+ start:146 stop:355 length:210 start_codon:yes stop_codon:yes gene_type:complete
MELVLIGFIAGCIVTKLVMPTKTGIPHPDTILKWDPTIFGYRPIVHMSEIEDAQKLLFAFEMKKKQNEE